MPLLWSCDRNTTTTASTHTWEKPDSLPNGNMLDETFGAYYDIYNLGDDIDSQAVIAAMAAAFPDLPRWDSVPDQAKTGGYLIRYFGHAQKDLPPGDSVYLSYMAPGLTDAQRDQLSKSDEAIMIGLVGKSQYRWDWNRKFCATIGEVIQGKKWEIFDEGSRKFYDPESWDAAKVETWKNEIPTMMSHFVVQAYRDDAGLCRVVTVGLEKFGMPNFVINETSCQSVNSNQNLINAIVQFVAENPDAITEGMMEVDLNKIKDDVARKELLENPLGGATGRARFSFRYAKHDEGDVPNTLLEIYTWDDAYSSQQAFQQALVSTMFGTSDSVKNVNHDDAALQAASERAKMEIPRLKKLFVKGLEFKNALLLKLPFKDDRGGEEWMWVEVTKWEGANITGILQSDPFGIADLKAGSLVSGVEGDVFDYILYTADGQEGNETGKVLEQMQGEMRGH